MEEQRRQTGCPDREVVVLQRGQATWRMRVLLMIAVFAAGACASSSLAPNVPFTTEASVAQGQTVNVVEGVSIRFIGVTGDSRCPADALCIQGGDAVVKMEIAADGSKREIELHTGDMKPVTSDAITVALLELAPYPFSSRTIEQKDYTARLKVTR